MTAARTISQVRFSRRYWLNVARFLVVALLVGLIAIVFFLGRATVRVVNAGIHPDRMVITETPADYGLTGYEDVSFVTADGLTLRGWYIQSQSGAAIILGHGHVASRQPMLPYAQMLAAHGYGILLFDWRAHGESDGDSVTLGAAEVQDFDAAVAYVASRPDVQPGRIGVLGVSMGAAIMTMGTARNPQVGAAVLEAAYPSLEDVTRFRLEALPPLQSFAIWYGQRETGSDIDLVRPVDEICDISPRPVFLIFGANDAAIPPDSAQRLSEAACEPKEVWMVEGGGHTDTYTLLLEEYERRVTAFFGAALLDQAP